MAAPQRLVILGAGGQARDVAWLVKEINACAGLNGERYELLGFVVSDLEQLGPHDSSAEVIGDLDWLTTHAASVDAVALGIGTPAARLRIAREVDERCPDLAWPALIHPTVLWDRETARIERGVTVCAGVVGTVNITLRELSLVNVACTLGHEAVIGRGTVINHAASISGGVALGDGVLIGTGARVLQYLEVGAGATVGAGAVVTRNVEPGAVVVGVPARPLEKGESGA
jgi:sugar O-acyltransferase (sialic acid O-acetyltransferase NeuD family)